MIRAGVIVLKKGHTSYLLSTTLTGDVDYHVSYSY